MSNTKEQLQKLKTDYELLLSEKKKLDDNRLLRNEKAEPIESLDTEIKKNINQIIQIVTKLNLTGFDEPSEETLNSLTESVEKFNEFMTNIENKLSLVIEHLKKDLKDQDHYFFEEKFFADVLSILDDKVMEIREKFRRLDLVEYPKDIPEKRQLKPLDFFLTLTCGNQAPSWIERFGKLRQNVFNRIFTTKVEYDNLVNTLAGNVKKQKEKNIILKETNNTNIKKNSELGDTLTNIRDLKNTTLPFYTKKAEHKGEGIPFEENINKASQAIKNSYILEDLKKILEKLNQTVSIFDDCPNPEDKDAHEMNTKRLNKVCDALSHFLTNEELESLTEVLAIEPDRKEEIAAQVREILVAYEKIQLQLSWNQSHNNQILLRYNNRAHLFSEFNKVFLTHITPQAFLTELKPLLSNWVKTGEGDDVLKSLRAHASLCTDTNQKVILDKMMVQILDAKRQISQGYDHAASLESQEVDKMGEILKSLENTQKKYVESIRELHAHVLAMRRYALDVISPADTACCDTVFNLTHELCTHISRFVMDSPNAKPDEKSFEAFRELFTARLNSKNDEMEKHRALWKPIVANILIGLTTLGLAILIKLVITQSFFFEKTRRQEHVDAIGESLAAAVKA